MANISHFTQTVNGVSTTYDIHDANAVPRSGGAVLSGQTYSRTIDDGILAINGSSTDENGAFLRLHGKDYSDTPFAGSVFIRANNGSNACHMMLKPDGTATWGAKNLAMQEDTVPRSGGAVINGPLMRNVDNDSLHLAGGSAYNRGADIWIFGNAHSTQAGVIQLMPYLGTLSSAMYMWLKPDGTFTWSGQPIQYVSDQRLKQQITQIDNDLLDAWEDVTLVQFKYNDAVDQKKDKARLHTGYVVQQIDKACKEHGVDISQYGLYCHEEYPEETEEIEVEQADGTKTKETKVIREASEHYSLRYTEVYAVECMYLRRCIARLTARIEELEKEQEASK